MKKFNVTGTCIPQENYMVDISKKIDQIETLVENGSYFVINRSRQYGKTTTLAELRKRLTPRYLVLPLSFESLGPSSFSTEANFCSDFLGLIEDRLFMMGWDENFCSRWGDASISTFKQLNRHLMKMTRNESVVLMIDEVDKVTDNDIFISFLSLLRTKYLASREGLDFTFQSVILAGVYDIKNIKLKLRQEGHHQFFESETKIQNSPWNIAVDFEVEMSFSPEEIATMLLAYEKDHQTGMDIGTVSNEIYGYTSGYPYLVSRICQHIDTKMDKDWTKAGVNKAVKLLTVEQNTLFDDLFKNVANRPELSRILESILLDGISYPYSHGDLELNLGIRYGFLKQEDGRITISNRIFEIVLLNHYIVKQFSKSEIQETAGSHECIQNGKLDMECCLRKFDEHYAQYNYHLDKKFRKNLNFQEKYGKFLFLTYLAPLINGTGFIYPEPETTHQGKMDLVVVYGGEEFIIELKVWRGEGFRQEGVGQLAGYLNNRKSDTGYMLTFDFRDSKKPKMEWLEYGGKRIFDVVV